MTVRLEARVHRYVGLSSDTKPYPGQYRLENNVAVETGADEIPVGSSFLEEDTARIYHWDGVLWRYSDSPEVQELRAIRGLLAAFIEKLAPVGF